MKKLTEMQAYNAMFEFLSAYYRRTNSDGVGSLLGDLQLGTDRMPADPAAWSDWQNCISKVLGESSRQR